VQNSDQGERVGASKKAGHSQHPALKTQLLTGARSPEEGGSNLGRAGVTRTSLAVALKITKQMPVSWAKRTGWDSVGCKANSGCTRTLIRRYRGTNTSKDPPPPGGSNKENSAGKGQRPGPTGSREQSGWPNGNKERGGSERRSAGPETRGYSTRGALSPLKPTADTGGWQRVAKRRENRKSCGNGEIKDVHRNTMTRSKGCREIRTLRINRRRWGADGDLPKMGLRTRRSCGRKSKKKQTNRSLVRGVRAKKMEQRGLKAQRREQSKETNSTVISRRESGGKKQNDPPTKTGRRAKTRSLAQGGPRGTSVRKYA